MSIRRLRLFAPSIGDISTHVGFDDGGRPGTYGNGAKLGKIDYILRM
jgi:hypothetical protein